MAHVVALCSAKGSPGVTTSALALAYAWPRAALVVEADVAAGSAILAGHLNGREAHERGMLGLGLAHRRNGRIDEEDVWRQALQLAPDRYLLPGLWDPVQAAQMASTWPAVASALTDLPDLDVIVDLGRLGTAFGAEPLLARSDLVLAVSRCSLPDTYALTRRVPALKSSLPGARLGLLTVGNRDPYPPAELARILDVPLVGELPWDPATSGLYSHGRAAPRRRSKGALESRAGQVAHDVLAAARRPLAAAPRPAP